MPISRAKWIKFIVSVVGGNLIYFSLAPHLPLAAQHHSWAVDLGTVVDFWFCLLIYGLLELGTFLRREHGRKPPPGE